jgi:outer membrane protein
MRKAVLLLMAFILLAVSAGAAYAAEDKLGYVDEIYLLNQFPKFKQAQAKLEEIAREKSNAAKAAFDKETDDKKKANIVQNMQLEMREEEAKVMTPILKEINAAIGKAAQSKGITVVINKGLVFYGGVDLTEDVLKLLK